MRRQGFVVALALMCLTAGCSSAEPQVAPESPSVVASATPSVSAEVQKAADFAAAEKSYRTFRSEYRRVLIAGGREKPSALMTRTAGGPYLDELMRVVQSTKHIHAKGRGSERVVVLSRTLVDDGRVRLETCEDARRFGFYQDGEEIGRDTYLRASLVVRRVNSSWRVWSGDGRTVKSCG